MSTPTSPRATAGKSPASSDPAANSSGSQVSSGEEFAAMDTIRRGIRISPEVMQGIWLTILLAVVGTGGRVVVPIAVQQSLDRGIARSGGVDTTVVATTVTVAGVALLIAALASFAMTARLFTAAERGLATLRIKAFRHVHDLPVLTQNTEKRGAMVSRVTSDVDQVSQFLVFGGIMGVVSIGQIAIATVIMAWYSWQLTLVVWVCFAPLFLSLRYFQQRLSAAYGVVRQQIGAMLAAIAEPIVGAIVVRSHAIEERTQRRIDAAIDQYVASRTWAQVLTAGTFSLGGVSAGLANALVLIIGIQLGFAGAITAGEVLAFVFLVTLFVGPVQMGTQVLTDAQNALAGWRRVIGVLETPADLTDPGEHGQELAPGPIGAEFDHVEFAYPDGPLVLHDINLRLEPRTRVAIVGETGSGKTTFAKLLTRLMDPSSGGIRLNGVDVRDIDNSTLRRRVVLVPQEGYLFDDTLAHNLAYGRLEATPAQMQAAIAELGLTDWVEGLPQGLQTRVGPRGEALSSGERQLVALIRAHLADPDLLVLDEATSSVDPALEMQLLAALEKLMAHRSSVTIAHRLSTAERADEVIVFDAGRVVQRGPHSQLVHQPGPYQRLYADWSAQHEQ